MSLKLFRMIFWAWLSTMGNLSTVRLGVLTAASTKACTVPSLLMHQYSAKAWFAHLEQAQRLLECELSVHRSAYMLII